jgi:hypothetical protein
MHQDYRKRTQQLQLKINLSKLLPVQPLWTMDSLFGISNTKKAPNKFFPGLM